MCLIWKINCKKKYILKKYGNNVKLYEKNNTRPLCELAAFIFIFKYLKSKPKAL